MRFSCYRVSAFMVSLSRMKMTNVNRRQLNRDCPLFGAHGVAFILCILVINITEAYIFTGLILLNT